MNINMYQWVALVNKHLSENDKSNFLFQELPQELQDNVLFRRAAHRDYIKKVSKKVPYTG